MSVDIIDNLRIQEKADEILAKAEVVFRRSAFNIEAKTKQASPVATGALRNSYQVEFEERFVAIIFSNLEYAKFVEFGTSRMAAQPHLTPALESERQVFFAAIRELFR